MNIIEMISQPWHWAFSGFMIVVVMFLLIWFGQRFGVSSSFKAICAIGGAGSKYSYFNYDWKSHDWLLMFIVGGVIGGAIGSTILASPAPVQISAATIADLEVIGIATPKTMSEGAGFVPLEIFNFGALASIKGFILLVVGGMMIGFGTRWAGGCTSGHAITGLSNLQLPSLVAVIGFFIGGLLVTHLLLPLIMKL